jgi:SAM-dependent methyltransferase
MLSADEQFYRTSAGAVPCLPTRETEELFFGYGKRHYICQESLDKNPPTRRNLIVELGCSNGQGLLYLKERYGFSRSIGIDLGFNTEHQLGSSVFKCGNLNAEWKIESASVDVLIAMMLLEHLFDPYFCFREISRVLTEGGRAFINLPLITDVGNRLRLLFGNMPVTSVAYSRWEKEGHWDGFHLHNFTLSSIRDLAAHANLSVRNVQGVGRMKKLKDAFPSLLCREISFELTRRV